MRKRAFTLIELLVVIAIIAILAAILFPVFAQAKDAAKQTHCVSNTKQVALAALMYAGDWEDVLPRHDNNGSCLYGERPCDTPDWGNFTLPSSNNIKQGEAVMYFGALYPYHKNTQISICPAIGNTRWAQAIATVTDITWGNAAPYDPAKEMYYYNTMGQMALNLYVIDWGPNDSQNRRPGAALGRLGNIERVSEVIMFTAESTWDWGPSIAAGLGNGAVWPSWPLNSQCYWYQYDGWTRYIHKGKSGTYTSGRSDRGTNNPNMQGYAVFALCDGHAKAWKFTYAERCVQIPGGQTWRIANRDLTMYYPSWVPEL